MGLILQNNLTAREFYPSGQALALIALPRHQRSGCPEIRRDSLSNANKLPKEDISDIHSHQRRRFPLRTVEGISVAPGVIVC
ncbi:hypothetical protein RB195_016843 [Necator americanus]|uniref:Uncharacterized protein n=1 Tax=Necator americanus TaxID=51031 RepID=A0ABR1C2F1_NECAM